MVWSVVLAILKKYWPVIVIGLLVTAAIGYVGVLKLEVSFWKKEAATQKASAKSIAKQFNDALAEAEAKEAQLQADNADLTFQFHNTLRDYGLVIIQRDNAIKERIAANAELHKLKLSLDLIRLFNASKQPPGEHDEVPATAVTGNDGKATTPVEVTGTDLFTVIAENDANHLKCIKTVEQWQSFWLRYVENVRNANAEAR